MRSFDPQDWQTMSPFQLIKEFNSQILKDWEKSGHKRLANRILVSRRDFKSLAETFIQSCNHTLLKFIVDNSVTTAAGGQLKIEWSDSVSDGFTCLEHEAD